MSRLDTVLLVRHGLTAMTGPVLAGRTPDLHLDERGTEAGRGRGRAHRRGAAAASSPAPWTDALETAQAIRAAQPGEPQWAVDERIIEVGYGDWTGRAIKDLAKDPLWKVVQAQPSAVRFPGGEALAEMAARAVAAIRDWDARLGEDAVWVACTPRRYDQGHRGRRARPAPRPVPAHRPRPVLGVGDPLHPDPSVRDPGQRRPVAT